jgi:hypothetical protein
VRRRIGASVLRTRRRYAGAANVLPNRPLQPPHSAVTPRAGARVAPAGGRLNGGVGRT